MKLPNTAMSHMESNKASRLMPWKLQLNIKRNRPKNMVPQQTHVKNASILKTIFRTPHSHQETGGLPPRITVKRGIVAGKTEFLSSSARMYDSDTKTSYPKELRIE